MSVRTSVPHPVKTLGRRVSVGVGTATSGWRQLPSFVMVGAQRAGTTSLYRALTAHPLVHSASFHKGVNYFDVNHHRDVGWYQGHFPTTASLHRATPAGTGEPVTFEASGYYMFHPCAPERMARLLPQLRLIAMLRDPVERAFSAHKHEHARGYDTEPSFERALALEDERLDGEVERMRRDPAYQSWSHRHHAYLRRGQYAEQLRELLRHFPAAQVHVVESERFFEEPEATYAEVLGFLGLPAFAPARFDRWNGRPSAPMPDALRARLRRHFDDHDEQLTELLGRRPAWRA